MEIKDIIQNKTPEEETAPVYIPSSSEKKRAVLMYLLIGIMVYLSKKDVNKFEYYHLKQATGRRILFLFACVICIVLLFIPVIKILAWLLIVIFVVAWCIWIKQARDGFYVYWSKTNFMSLFSGVGNWFLELFEINMRQIDVDDSIQADQETPIEEKDSDPIDADLQKDLDTDNEK